MKIIHTISLAAVIGLASLSAIAGEAAVKTVASVHQEKAALAGQIVRVEGKVVKVNNGIMKRNFVHVQDGSGEAGSNTLIVTSAQTANVGEPVSVSGLVVLGRDFGGGYSYPLLLEEAKITVTK